MKIINKFLWLVAVMKIYLSRAVTYVSIMNFVLIFATFQKAYDINLNVYALTSVGVVMAIIVGYVDYKVVFEHENIYRNKKNDIRYELDKINKKIDAMMKVK